jgi:uncharacterized protein
MSHQNHQRFIASLDPKYLELTLFPTEQCNFRCTYCYEDFSIGKMKQETINSVKNLLNNRIGSLKRLNLQWFGGEPLAAKDIIYEISTFAQSLCTKHNVHFSGGITTNGYLLDIPTVRRLHELGQRGYQISLDGFGAVHNSTRKLASGGATFDRIIANLKAMRDSELPLSVVLRVHLSTENHESVKELARMLRRDFLHDGRFSIFLKPIENLGGPNSAKIVSLTQKDRQFRLNELKHLLYGENPDQENISGNHLQICYASRPNSLVIRADGRVQKCTVLLSDPRNTVGEITPDGRIHLDHSLMGNWMRGYATGDFKTLSCPATNITQPRTSRIIPISQIA